MWKWTMETWRARWILNAFATQRNDVDVMMMTTTTTRVNHRHLDDGKSLQEDEIEKGMERTATMMMMIRSILPNHLFAVVTQSCPLTSSTTLQHSTNTHSVIHATTLLIRSLSHTLTHPLYLPHPLPPSHSISHTLTSPTLSHTHSLTHTLSHTHSYPLYLPPSHSISHTLTSPTLSHTLSHTPTLPPTHSHFSHPISHTLSHTLSPTPSHLSHPPPSGDRAACYWYRSSSLGAAKYQPRPKSAIVLCFNADGTYTVELELGGQMLDDVAPENLKPWSEGTADLRPGGRTYLTLTFTFTLSCAVD